MTTQLNSKILNILDYLVCPKCKTRLIYEAKQLYEPHRSADIFVYYLFCGSCNIKYPIIEGIPRFDKIYEFPEGSNHKQFVEEF